MGSVAIDRRSHGDFLGALSIAQEVHEKAVQAYGEEDPSPSTTRTISR